jgi:hypothetical protein
MHVYVALAELHTALHSTQGCLQVVCIEGTIRVMACYIEFVAFAMMLPR